jgi:hypothetical protein
MNLLDSNNPSITKPLWWSGFHVSCDEGIEKLNQYKTKLDVYTDTDSELSKSYEYTKLREDCKDDKKLTNFEAILSTYFTLNGLNKLSESNEIKLSVLLNKSINTNDKCNLQNSYFYKTELNIILEYCKKHNKKCKIYIHNLLDNCGNVKDTLKNYIKEIGGNEYINFNCVRYYL